MTKRYWLTLLLAFLRPAVEGAGDAAGAQGGEGGGDQAPAGDGDQGAGDDQLDLDLNAGDQPGDQASDSAKELEAARKAAKDAEERAAKFEREAADLRVRHAPPAPNDIEAQENAKLANPNTTDLEKWQIQSNRTLRANTSAAQMALAQANDVSDRTAFASIAMTDPIAKKYESRVEETLAKARAQGQNPRREDIYTYLLGQDMRGGKFTKKKAAAAEAGGGVPRGKLPNAGGDVPRKGGMTERERRAQRLENQQI